MKGLLLGTTMLTFGIAVPQPAEAMPPLVAALASVAVSLLTGGAMLTFTGFGLSLTGFSAVFAHFAVRAALGYALDSLTPARKRPAKTGRGYTANLQGSDLPHAIIYGQTRVGGVPFYREATGTNNRYHHVLIAFAGHEIEEYTEIYLNDEACTFDGSGNITSPASYVGFVRILEHLGTSSQAADTTLIAESSRWASSDQAKGIAYLYCRFDYDATAFPNGLPIVSALIKGRKIYDPRTATTAWSANPALCWRDYLTADFGMGEATATINDVRGNVAADICDELVDLLTRFTCNGSFTLDNRPEDIVRLLLSSMGGFHWFEQGSWSCKAAAYVTPTVTFTEDDFRGNLSIATRNSARDNFNTVIGTYRGLETQYQESDYPSVSGGAYITEDNGETITVDLPLLFTRTKKMAQRIATIALKRNREQITISAPFGLAAFDVAVGDTVMVTNTRMNWTAKTFEVTDWRFGLTSDMDLQASLSLREINADVFNNVLAA